GDPNMYVKALGIMTDPARRPVLIHCAASAERTGCAVAMYRHIYEGVPLEETLEEARRHRHDPERTPQVGQVLREWTDDVARSLETGEPIPYEGGTKKCRRAAAASPPSSSPSTRSARSSSGSAMASAASPPPTVTAFSPRTTCSMRKVGSRGRGGGGGSF